MAKVKFWDLEERLVATIEDGAAVWTGSEWRLTTAAHARKALLDGEEITAGQTAKRFPGADIAKVPTAKLEQANNTAIAGQNDTDASELDRIEAQLDGE